MAFINRVVEHPNRVTLTDGDGTVSGPYTITRSEGVVTAEGTALTAENLNAEIQAQAKSLAQAAANTAVANANTQLSRIRRGTTYKTVSQKKTATGTVNFGITFPAAPHVVVTPITGNPANIRASVKSRNTTSFTVSIYNGTKSKAKVWFAWIAIY